MKRLKVTVRNFDKNKDIKKTKTMTCYRCGAKKTRLRVSLKFGTEQKIHVCINGRACAKREFKKGN